MRLKLLYAHLTNKITVLHKDEGKSTCETAGVTENLLESAKKEFLNIVRRFK